MWKNSHRPEAQIYGYCLPLLIERRFSSALSIQVLNFVHEESPAGGKVSFVNGGSEKDSGSQNPNVDKAPGQSSVLLFFIEVMIIEAGSHALPINFTSDHVKKNRVHRSRRGRSRNKQLHFYGSPLLAVMACFSCQPSMPGTAQ